MSGPKATLGGKRLLAPYFDRLEGARSNQRIKWFVDNKAVASNLRTGSRIRGMNAIEYLVTKWQTSSSGPHLIRLGTRNNEFGQNRGIRGRNRLIRLQPVSKMLTLQSKSVVMNETDALAQFSGSEQ